MSLTRSKLMLDEQSFQGLLAAAFTIQQHNERQRASGANSNGKEDPLQQSGEVCRQCGIPFPTGRAQCPTCDTGNFRPGERLQRNWASMWLKSQERLLGAQDREEPAPDAPSLAVHHWEKELSAAAPPPAMHAEEFISDETEHNSDDANEFTLGSEPRVTDPTAAEQAVAIPALGGRGFGDLPGKDEHVDTALSGDLAIGSPVVVENSLVLAGPESPGAIRSGLLDLRVKLRFHRADLYLGIAVVVAVFALLFPATATQSSALRPWERMLIAIGLAEPPDPAAVHNGGDPNIKVWVDTHTALYYCPGSELYGKSADGHYSTQREAQTDHFEPAERVVCVE